MPCTFDAWQAILEAFHRNPSTVLQLYVPRKALEEVVDCHLEGVGGITNYHASDLIVEQPHKQAKEVQVRRSELFNLFQAHPAACAIEITAQKKAAEENTIVAREHRARGEVFDGVQWVKQAAPTAAEAELRAVVNRSRAPDVGDDIAGRLRGMTVIELKGLAISEGFEQKWNEQWSKLPNPGLIRMQMGNMLRNKAKKAK